MRGESIFLLKRSITLVIFKSLEIKFPTGLLIFTIIFYTEWKNRGEHWGEKLTEDHLEEAASTYSRGELPLVQRVLTLTDPRNRELADLPYLHRAVRHPLRSLQYAYGSLLDIAWTFVYPRAYVILLILILTPLDSLLMIIPMAVFHGSFLTMVVSTLQMLQTKREYSHFRVWSQLFLSYDRDGHLNTEDPEFVYIKKVRGLPMKQRARFASFCIKKSLRTLKSFLPA